MIKKEISRLKTKEIELLKKTTGHLYQIWEEILELEVESVVNKTFRNNNLTELAMYQKWKIPEFQN